MRGAPSKAQNITVMRPFSRRCARVSAPLPVRSRRNFGVAARDSGAGRAVQSGTSSVLGTSLVVALVDTTVGSHLNKVESTVQTARQLGDVDVEGELLADEVEHLVLGVALHEVGTRTNVSRVRALGDELEGQRVAAGSDTVGT